MATLIYEWLYTNRIEWATPVINDMGLVDDFTQQLEKEAIENDPKIHVAPRRTWHYINSKDVLDVGSNRTLRIYWNVCFAGAVPLVKTLRRTITNLQTRFIFKILNDPQCFFRADAAVLYLPMADWPIAAPVVKQVHQHISVFMKEQTPMFTARLAKGLAGAEDPQQEGTSFGMHRSRLAAEGLWDAREAASKNEMISIMGSRFRRAGISLSSPHLGPNSDANDEGWLEKVFHETN